MTASTAGSSVNRPARGHRTASSSTPVPSPNQRHHHRIFRAVAVACPARAAPRAVPTSDWPAMASASRARARNVHPSNATW